MSGATGFVVIAHPEKPREFREPYRDAHADQPEDEPGVPRPDLNIVFDQVTYRPENNSLYYFTGGLTAQYDVGRRRWRDRRLVSRVGALNTVGGERSHVDGGKWRYRPRLRADR